MKPPIACILLVVTRTAFSRVALLSLLFVVLGGCGWSHKAATSGPRSARASEAPRDASLDLGGGLKMDIVLIPAGTFMMGSGESRFDDAKPVHEVAISRPFYLGRYPVTQEQWQVVMENNPSRFKGPANPVEGVSWDEAQDFCRKLSGRIGKLVRLPTEAEWEFACRAGSATDRSGDSERDLAEHGWYESNSSGATHAVGGKKPNAWGLYDMQGNVWEWCQDWYDQRYYENSPRVDPSGPARSILNAHVLRGGAWHTEATYCRSTSRGGDFPCGEGGPDSWSNAGRSGLRVVCVTTASGRSSRLPE